MLFSNFRIIMFILYFTTHAVDAAYLRCYRNSIKDYMEVHLKKSSDLMNKSYIKLNQELDIVIHGYSAEISVFIENIIENLIKVFGNTKSYCALNWKKEGRAYIGDLTMPIKKATGIKLFGVDYFLVSAIACQVGHDLGKALIKMVKLGLKMETVYLIGHSEGAHLAGAAGRTSKASGQLIGRITALDPAKPPVQKRLDKSCAKLVDVVHTNTALYGSSISLGHIDFWVNFGCKVQPGCKENSSPLSIFSLCSHTRAMSLMADAIIYPNSLQGRRANSYKKFMKDDTPPKNADINVIGLQVIPSNQGSFYLCTNAQSEYGKDLKGMDPASCKC